MTDQRWQFWVDRGGTFTDVVARAPDGRFERLKLLSEDPGRYEDAAVEAMRRLTGVSEGDLPAAELRLGTTVATNALLEGKGEPVLLAITRGFGDALRIGTQERPDIFARHIVLPEPLHGDVLEIEERVGADGTVHVSLDEVAARKGLQEALVRGLRAVAIVLMHGYRYTAHEARLAQIAHEVGFTQVSVSHEVAPLIKLIARGDTTVVDANLSPVLRRYVSGLEVGLGPCVDALYMQSSGGLTTGEAFRGKDAILSGPAGGIVGMAAVAKEAGFDHVIGFDMGGTSTDVSHYAGQYERDSETRVAGTRVRTPMMRIETVAAGGGSICRFDGARFLVGPESAGAVPGPACYRRGGPLAVTDCNLLLGKLRPAHFPHVFGPAGDEPLSLDAAQERMDAVVAAVRECTGRELSREEAAEGFLEIAVANMANAIKTVSLRRGHDVTRAALVTFGGAGGQHACKVADALGVTTVLCHPLASVLSAYGMGLADRRLLQQQTLAAPLDAEGLAAIEDAVAALGVTARAGLAAQGLAAAAIRIEATVAIRPKGSDNAVEVRVGSLEDMRAGFRGGWQRRFGFGAGETLIAETLRVEAIAGGHTGGGATLALPQESRLPAEQVAIWTDGASHEVPLYLREGLAEGFTAEGPLLVVDDVSTTVVEPGWAVRVDAIGNLVLTREAPQQASVDTSTACDPVRLEIMGALFMAIAEEMGAALQFSASSVNIRERLDFSCAVFDRAGNLIANAPHMPVHLGSMGESVRTVLRRRVDDGRGLLPGDVYVLNAPYDGGTHLPDVTVVMPVFAGGDDAAPAWFVAARGHHADIGGISPGSMPPDSHTLEEEGVLLDNVLLVDRGTLQEEVMRALLASGPYPSRAIDQNLADLRAQLAACARGASELRRLAAEQGRSVVDAYMGHAQDYAEQAVRALIGRLFDGTFTVPMDNGAVIRVSVSVDREARGITIDFAGTSAQLPDNFNAPLPVVRAAVLYVVRTLLDDAVPMNEGCLRPVTLLVPEGSMLHPKAPAAVVAGNVETSQAITDALFAALGAMAASQGTMNNFTFGDATRQYYETIAGGSGAGPDFDGTSVVQTHMTNSRLTDPEVLETNFPVLLEEFSIRRGSGGKGAHRGGDGAVRRVRFLESMQAGILANRRKFAPFGLNGGGDGEPGCNRIERAEGSVENLDATASVSLSAGDVFVIETPGGGGYGAG
ncbi:hydantoinase B/oxoprolinase family protein [Novosphingobium album (ex Hu et al. 2023)]|uniref:Hydantoinase B/oxoprolinase family protein n=1 Tax=Novosphingobium album (ex Hu et al. 2023) TaxID=2930093 RepID=A0ABT0B6K8_9SPHN|nr:hydantoinase B/oxoprolinase family protein [Novosphingobium album (ex Hu et al. 2023)]MCJ2180511.1 hydantoinase B/oxoprolinase family protein [Novosphingobium album (ex Hu et al. 2023)]